MALTTPNEGQATKEIEKVTSKLPSTAYLHLPSRQWQPLQPLNVSAEIKMLFS